MLSNGANAIQLHTNVDGAPIDQDQFLPIYEIIEKSGKPILLHPIRTREMADYRTETKSKYEICSVIGWPFETGAALARLVFSGIMDRFPDLKVITHHLGGIIPYFEGRVAHSWDQLGARTSDEDYSLLLKKLKKRPFDYFKGFYGDTALAGARAPTDLRNFILRGGPCAVRLRLSVRQGEGQGLHPCHDRRHGVARSAESGHGEDLPPQCGDHVRIACALIEEMTSRPGEVVVLQIYAVDDGRLKAISGPGDPAGACCRALDRRPRPDPRRAAGDRAGARHQAVRARGARDVSNLEPAARIRRPDDADRVAADGAARARSGPDDGFVHPQQGTARDPDQGRSRRSRMADPAMRRLCPARLDRRLSGPARHDHRACGRRPRSGGR